MRLATFNLESLDLPPKAKVPIEVRAEVLRPALSRLDADVLCLQEVNGQHVPDRPERILLALDQLLEDGAAASFDFAFIDADKSNYDAYYERSLELLRPGGVVAVDNALWGGSVADASDQRTDTVAIRALNSKALRDPRVSASLVPIGDGVLIARKRSAH